MSRDITDEPGLVTASIAGDQNAFGVLYMRYRRMVHAIALARVGSSDADDVVQEVFMLAMRKLESLRDRNAFGGWLGTIARNRALGWRRSEPLGDELTDQPTPSRQETNEEARRVLMTIRSLPEAYRETLMMRLVEGMTGPEIAEQTGLTADSVRVNLHRGMRLLREALEKAAP